MIEPRDYTPEELLAWCRFVALSFIGTALAYARDQDGSADAFVAYAGERLAAAWGGAPGGGIEPAMLGLLLNVESLGAEIHSHAVNPEAAEAHVSNLPGPRVCADLEHRFEVSLTPEDILTMLGVTQEEMNRVYDVLGQVAAASGLEFGRDDRGREQALRLRVW